MDIKAISTYIATVIVVTITIGIGVVMYLYFSGYFYGITGEAEKQQRGIFECVGAALDIDYFPSGGGNITLLVINTGKVTFSNSFSIAVEYVGGSKSESITLYDRNDLPSGSFFYYNITGLSGKTVNKVTVTPLGKCSIQFSQYKEVVVS